MLSRAFFCRYARWLSDGRHARWLSSDGHNVRWLSNGQCVRWLSSDGRLAQWLSNDHRARWLSSDGHRVRWLSSDGRLPRFSESAAFRGVGPGSGRSPVFIPDYYRTQWFGTLRIISALASVLAVIVYFGWLREANDLDQIFDMPAYVLTCNVERKMLREQIKRAEASGQDSSLLKAELQYVDVKEAMMKLKEDADARSRNIEQQPTMKLKEENDARSRNI